MTYPWDMPNSRRRALDAAARAAAEKAEWDRLHPPCEHTRFKYTFDCVRGASYSTLTGDEPPRLVLNRYCRDCNKQMGSLEDEWSTGLSSLELRSSKLDRYWDEQHGRV